jgi:sporulation protein YlmC with PRC-barrel domain
MIRVSELVGKPVRTESGEKLGRVHEIRVDGNRVDALICGSRGFLQRMGPARAGRRVKWQRVRRVTPREIVCSD